MNISVYCQNTAQAGDRYGVTISLLLNPSAMLLLFVHCTKEGINRADNWLEIYENFGINKERMKVLCLLKDDINEISVLGDKHIIKQELNNLLIKTKKLKNYLYLIEDAKLEKGKGVMESINANLAYKAITSPHLSEKENKVLMPKVENILTKSINIDNVKNIKYAYFI